MASASAAVATDTDGSVVVEPEPLGEPVMGPCVTRDCQVVDEQGQVRWVRCVVASEIGLAYCFVRTLRECIYGVVRHGVTLVKGSRHGDDGLYRYDASRQVAIKCMSKRLIARQRGRIREDPINELAALQLLAAPGHAHVQRLVASLEDADTIYAVCPFYAGGELFSLIETRGAGLPEDQARGLFCQIAAGLEYMHARRLCHRDLSLENILLTGSGAGAGADGVIIDMGMCLRVPADDRGRRVLIRRQGQCGKITYMSNEVFEDSDFDGACGRTNLRLHPQPSPLTPPIPTPPHQLTGFAVDMWAMGIVLFILLAGVPPLELPTLADPRFKMIATGRLEDLLTIWQLRLSRPARNLLGRLLEVDPTRRATLPELMAHPWVTGAG